VFSDGDLTSGAGIYSPTKGNEALNCVSQWTVASTSPYRKAKRVRSGAVQGPDPVIGRRRPAMGISWVRFPPDRAQRDALDRRRYRPARFGRPLVEFRLQDDVEPVALLATRWASRIPYRSSSCPPHTPALPFSGWVLRAQKPFPKGYPKSPKTLEEHLKRRRLDLGMQMKELAALLGVHPATIRNWEHGRSTADLRSIPAAIQFLGNDPPAGRLVPAPPPARSGTG
jgi:DNA-binding XRE family transcriptional regulator